MDWLRNLSSRLRSLLLLCLAVLFLLPIGWMLIASLWPDFQPLSVIWHGSFAPTLANYGTAVTLFPAGRFTLNSLRVVAIATPLSVVVASLAGFALTRLPSRLQLALLGLSLAALLVPPTLLWLVRFPLFKLLGWIDTPWALVAPAFMGGTPLFVLLFFWSFRRLPAELLESAVLDGASEWQLWWHLVLPLSRHTVAGVAVLNVVLFWSNFTDPLLYLRSEAQMTLPVGVQRLAQLDSTRWPVMAAGAVLLTLPVLLVFLWGQRYFWQTWNLSRHEK